MWPKKKTNVATPPPFDRLIVDVLRLVLEEILLADGKAGLLSVCLVCRHLYLLTVPCLYRTIILEMTRASHIHLTKRLSKPGSQLPGLIRNLVVSEAQEKHAASLHELNIIVAGLKHLIEVSWWSGSLEMPLPLLDIVYNKFPKAKFNVQANQAKLLASPDKSPSLSQLTYPVLRHMAAGGLTYFDFQPLAADQMYPEFKRDLVKMLSQNTALLTLQIFPNVSVEVDYPEMIDSFRQSELPKLQILNLCITAQIFTQRELAVWSSKGGWQELRGLSLYYAKNLIHFIDKAPLLTSLSIFPRSQEDYQELEDHLDTAGLTLPLPSLYDLTFRGTISYATFTLPQERCIVPWCLLKRIPKLIILDIARVRFENGTPGPILDVPSALDIQEIRKFCPEIQRLSLDIVLQGHYAKWPLDVLNDLAQFHQPIQLKFYLHHEECRRAAFMVSCIELFAVMRHLRRERKRRSLPIYWPFHMDCKTIRPFHEIQKHWNLPDWTIWIDGGIADNMFFHFHNHKLPKVHPDRLSCEELEIKKAKQLSRLFGFDREHYGQEIKRREQCAGEKAGFATDATLYDLWTRQ